MEPLGHVAGTGSSIYGSITMAVGSTLGFLIGQQFDGTAVPLTAGYVLCALAALGIVAVTERGVLFGRTGATVA
jgi:DHA1 family bicyclomycin/chloramphenicol resistance-like MFS transporter